VEESKAHWAKVADARRLVNATWTKEKYMQHFGSTVKGTHPKPTIEQNAKRDATRKVKHSNKWPSWTSKVMYNSFFDNGIHHQSYMCLSYDENSIYVCK